MCDRRMGEEDIREILYPFCVRERGRKDIKSQIIVW